MNTHIYIHIYIHMYIWERIRPCGECAGSIGISGEKYIQHVYIYIYVCTYTYKYKYEYTYVCIHAYL